MKPADKDGQAAPEPPAPEPRTPRTPRTTLPKDWAAHCAKHGRNHPSDPAEGCCPECFIAEHLSPIAEHLSPHRASRLRLSPDMVQRALARKRKRATKTTKG